MQQAVAYNERGIPHINDLANSKLSNFNNETEPRNGKTVIFYNEKASAVSSNQVTNNVSEVITPNVD